MLEHWAVVVNGSSNPVASFYEVGEIMMQLVIKIMENYHHENRHE